MSAAQQRDASFACATCPTLVDKVGNLAGRVEALETSNQLAHKEIKDAIGKLFDKVDALRQQAAEPHEPSNGALKIGRFRVPNTVVWLLALVIVALVSSGSIVELATAIGGWFRK